MKAIPWQVRFRKGIARPGVRLGALSVSRSNGKSFLVADLAREYLFGEHHGTEALVVASDFRQAKIIVRYLVEMLRAHGIDTDDRSRWLHRDSVNQGLLRDKRTGITVRAMSSRPAGLHGRVFGLALIDEPREIEPGQRDDLLAALTSGMGKVPGAKVIALGTMPADPSHWFRSWCAGEADYRQVHQARESDPVFWLKTIRRANPSFDYLPALRADLLARREKAREYPDALDEWRARHLNLGVSDRAGGLFLSVEDWTALEALKPPQLRSPVVWGCDPGGSSAFSAIAAYAPATGALEGLLTCGGVPSLRDRARHDHVGRVYDSMVREGSLIVQPGRRRPSLVQFIRDAVARFGKPRVIVTDFFRYPELADALDMARVRCEVVKRRSRYSEATEDIRRAQRLLLDDRRVVAPMSVAWSYSIGEARIVHDADNMRLAVGAEAGRRRRARTDLTSALVFALGEADRRWPTGIVRRPSVRLVAV